MSHSRGHSLGRGQSIFSADEGRGAGIYLWTVQLAHGYLIYYVGETGRTFRDRLAEHYKEHASGMYHVWSPIEFARGEKVELRPGRYDCDRNKRKSLTECIEHYTRLTGAIREMTYLLRLLLAPLSCDKRIRRRIEAAIAQCLYNAPDVVGTFQDQIPYQPRMEHETAITCTISSTVQLLGLPERFLA